MIRALSLTTLALLGGSVFGFEQQPVIERLDGHPLRASQIDETVERLMREAHVTGAGKEGHDAGWRHLALCFNNGSGILIMTNSSNGEGVFKPLMNSILGATLFPFDWENYTPYNLLPPLPKLKEHKTLTLPPESLKRLAGRYALTTNIVLTVTVESGRLLIQENDEPKQEYRAESAVDFYSTSSSDECTFQLPAEGPAQALILHVDGRDVELKRLP